MERPRSAASDGALIAVFAALIAVFALTPAVPVGIGVPITLQTLAVAVTGLVLGPWRGFLATALYVAVGLAGLPIFAGGGAGLAALAKPAAGYLVSFPLVALVTGALAYRLLRGARRRLPAALAVAALIGSLFVCAPLGVAGMMVNAGLPLRTALLTSLLYVPGDLVKSVLAGLIAAVVHRAFPALARRRRPGTVAAA